MKKVLIIFATIVLMTSLFALTVSAGDTKSSSSTSQDIGTSLADSKLVTGTNALVSDAQGILIGLSIVIGGGFATYYFIRKGMADEHDQPMWKKRIIGAGLCTVGAVLASTVLPIIVGYYR